MNSKSLFMKVHEENSIPIMPYFFLHGLIDRLNISRKLFLSLILELCEYAPMDG